MYVQNPTAYFLHVLEYNKTTKVISVLCTLNKHACFLIRYKGEYYCLILNGITQNLSLITSHA